MPSPVNHESPNPMGLPEHPDYRPFSVSPVVKNSSDLTDHDASPFGPSREPLPDLAQRPSAADPLSGKQSTSPYIPDISKTEADIDQLPDITSTSTQSAAVAKPVTLEPTDIYTTDSSRHSDSPFGADSTDSLDIQTGRTGTAVPVNAAPVASQQIHQPASGESYHLAPEGAAPRSVGNPNDLFVDDEEFVALVTSPIYAPPMPQQAVSEGADESETLHQAVPGNNATHTGRATSPADRTQATLEEIELNQQGRVDGVQTTGDAPPAQQGQPVQKTLIQPPQYPEITFEPVTTDLEITFEDRKHGVDESQSLVTNTQLPGNHQVPTDFITFLATEDQDILERRTKIAERPSQSGLDDGHGQSTTVHLPAIEQAGELLNQAVGGGNTVGSDPSGSLPVESLTPPSHNADANSLIATVDATIETADLSRPQMDGQVLNLDDPDNLNAGSYTDTTQVTLETSIKELTDLLHEIRAGYEIHTEQVQVGDPTGLSEETDIIQADMPVAAEALQTNFDNQRTKPELDYDSLREIHYATSLRVMEAVGTADLQDPVAARIVTDFLREDALERFGEKFTNVKLKRGKKLTVADYKNSLTILQLLQSRTDSEAYREIYQSVINVFKDTLPLTPKMYSASIYVVQNSGLTPTEQAELQLLISDKARLYGENVQKIHSWRGKPTRYMFQSAYDVVRNLKGTTDEEITLIDKAKEMFFEGKIDQTKYFADAIASISFLLNKGVFDGLTVEELRAVGEVRGELEIRARELFGDNFFKQIKKNAISRPRLENAAQFIGNLPDRDGTRQVLSALRTYNAHYSSIERAIEPVFLFGNLVIFGNKHPETIKSLQILFNLPPDAPDDAYTLKSLLARGLEPVTRHLPAKISHTISLDTRKIPALEQSVHDLSQEKQHAYDIGAAMLLQVYSNGYVPDSQFVTAIRDIATLKREWGRAQLINLDAKNSPGNPEIEQRLKQELALIRLIEESIARNLQFHPLYTDYRLGLKTYYQYIEGAYEKAAEVKIPDEGKDPAIAARRLYESSDGLLHDLGQIMSEKSAVAQANEKDKHQGFDIESVIHPDRTKQNMLQSIFTQAVNHLRFDYPQISTVHFNDSAGRPQTENHFWANYSSSFGERFTIKTLDESDVTKLPQPQTIILYGSALFPNNPNGMYIVSKSQNGRYTIRCISDGSDVEGFKFTLRHAKALTERLNHLFSQSQRVFTY